jgi:hypothetical protein
LFPTDNHPLLTNTVELLYFTMKTAITLLVGTLAVQRAVAPLVALLIPSLVVTGVGLGFGLGLEPPEENAHLFDKRSLHESASVIAKWKQNHPDRTEELDTLLAIRETSQKTLLPSRFFQMGAPLC